MTATRVLFPLAGILRVASRIVCLIVVASFVIFAVGQTGAASTHQVDKVSETTTTTQPEHKGTAHKVLDEVAGKLTSPFSGVTAGSTSQWVIRGVGTLMALLVYGVGLGYIARVLRIRV
jgi:hypothetical protein